MKGAQKKKKPFLKKHKTKAAITKSGNLNHDNWQKKKKNGESKTVHFNEK